jgi:hypothetical protein
MTAFPFGGAAMLIFSSLVSNGFANPVGASILKDMADCQKDLIFSQ